MNGMVDGACGGSRESCMVNLPYKNMVLAKITASAVIGINSGYAMIEFVFGFC